MLGRVGGLEFNILEMMSQNSPRDITDRLIDKSQKLKNITSGDNRRQPRGICTKWRLVLQSWYVPIQIAQCLDVPAYAAIDTVLISVFSKWNSPLRYRPVLCHIFTSATVEYCRAETIYHTRLSRGTTDPPSPCAVYEVQIGSGEMGQCIILV